MTNGYQANDVISMRFVKGTKVRILNFTLTAGDISNGSRVVNTTIFGLREHTFDTINTLYSDNLPPDFTDSNGSTSVSWNTSSAFPEDSPNYPVIIVDPARVSSMLLTLDSSQDDNEVIVEIEFMSRARFGKKRIDKGRDFMENVLKDNEATLNYAGFFFQKPEYIDDSDVGSVIVDKQKFNLANQILKFRWEN